MESIIHLIWQIVRITIFITAGLFAANMLEALNLSHRFSILARPLIRLGHLSTVTGASFALAFFSGVTANTILAEAYGKGEMSRCELLLANLFNSIPRFFLHLPTVFFLTIPFIHSGACIYVGLTFSAAIIQTTFVIAAGRLLLPPEKNIIAVPLEQKRVTICSALAKSNKCLKKRLVKIVKIMVPIYLIFFIAEQVGFFTRLNYFIIHNIWFLSWLKPEAIGIVVLHITTEFSASLSAASVLLADNHLSIKEVVLALLVGNILATPIRAIRHQLPYYSGIYPPKLAVQLIATSQITRAACVIIVAVLYFFWG